MREVTTPEALAASLGAVQAQEKASALLALSARSVATTEEELKQALEVKRTVLRTWCLRGTLHIVATDDLYWLLSLITPRLLKNSRRRYQQLELDKRTLSRATELILVALAENGPLTRAELAAYLAAENVSAEGQRMPHLLRRAALLRLICMGPERSGLETYVSLDDWVDLPPPKEESWETLATRYLASYGPASVPDFARWSGARLGQARQAFAAQKDTLVEAEAEGETLWLLAAQAERLLGEQRLSEPPARLLPAYDPLLLGYHSRDWLVEAAHAGLIHPGGGFLRPTLLVGGEATGTWKVSRRDHRLEVAVRPFTSLAPRLTRALEDEVDALGRFYGIQATLTVTPAQ